MCATKPRMLINPLRGYFHSHSHIPLNIHQIMHLALQKTVLYSSYRRIALEAPSFSRLSFSGYSLPARKMSSVSESQPKNDTQPQKPKAPGKKEVKILMLHGEYLSLSNYMTGQ